MSQTPLSYTGEPSAPVERAHERHVARSIRCDLGEVVDLSGAGVRVAGTKRPSGTVRLQLYALDWNLELSGRVVWSRIVERFRTEVGIHFVGLTSRETRELAAMAKGSRRVRFL